MLFVLCNKLLQSTSCLYNLCYVFRTNNSELGPLSFFMPIVLGFQQIGAFAIDSEWEMSAHIYFCFPQILHLISAIWHIVRIWYLKILEQLSHIEPADFSR